MTRKSAAPTYLREATLTYRAVRGTPRDLFPDKPITSSADLDRLLRPMLAGRITESLVVLALTGRHTVIGLHEVARGAVNHVHCAPCDLFRYPLMAGAVSLILAHNHPSADASPSPDDLALTERCVRLGFELGLTVLDHVIVVQDGYFSMLDAGLLRAGIEDGGGRSTWAKGRAPRPYGVSSKRVALGQVCVTPGVLGSCSSERIALCLGQHARGDWGCVDAEDAVENDRALVDGARILSCYAIDAAKPATGDNRLWVITERDRSLTTCLLPSEY